MKKDSVFRVVIVIAIIFIVYFFGVRPFITGDIFVERNTSKLNWAKGISSDSKDEYDLIVYGQEPEGIAAAISAARLGARTLLLSDGSNLGGSVAEGMITGLDVPTGSNGELLNGGILAEFNHKLGKEFSPERYTKIIEEFVRNENSIDVVYNAAFSSAEADGERVRSINVKADGKLQNYKGRIFIDASRSGELLEVCKVPFFKGSEDLHLSDEYMPVALNFEMRGEGALAITKMMHKNAVTVLNALKGYVAQDLKVRINNFNIVNTGTQSIIIRGIELADINVDNADRVKEAYETGVKEAKELSVFLANKLPEFKGWKFSKAAKSLYIPEYRHFEGLYRLSVNDVLENRYFDNTIAMGSKTVEVGKLSDGKIKILGKPVQYGIPMGCIIAKNKANLLMVGAKASYSSLAASSAGNAGTNIATGEAAGLFAVYSLLKEVDPASIEKLKKLDDYEQIQKYLKKQSYYIPKLAIKNENDKNWSYPAARQLVALGLVAGGSANNLGFERKAAQSDLAMLLLNGIYRVSPEKYNLAVDARIRPFFKNDPLNKKSAAAIIAALYEIKGNDLYSEVCKHGFINEIMRLRLKDRDALNMEDVYYLAAYNIRSFTGKDIEN